MSQTHKGVARREGCLLDTKPKKYPGPHSASRSALFRCPQTAPGLFPCLLAPPFLSQELEEWQEGCTRPWTGGWRKQRPPPAPQYWVTLLFLTGTECWLQTKDRM